MGASNTRALIRTSVNTIPIYKMERFSMKCHKAKPKVITTTDEMKGKYPWEIMRNQSQSSQSAVKSARQHGCPIRDWFKFCICLVERVARVFLDQSQSEKNQTRCNIPVYFRYSIENFSLSAALTRKLLLTPGDLSLSLCFLCFERLCLCFELPCFLCFLCFFFFSPFASFSSGFSCSSAELSC